MNTYRPSVLQELLKSWGVSAKKGMSQNFLIDGNIIRKIVLLAGVVPGDHVIEIGPGPGALTEALLENGAQVTAIEMDKHFSTVLERLQTPDHRLNVIQDDFLKYPLEELFAAHPRTSFKIVANLPYHITTPILTRLLPLHHHVDSLTIMVQKQFADRMKASSKTSDFSSFTVFLDFYSDLVKSFDVSPNCFYPRPKVHSTVVHCKLHPPLLEDSVDEFFIMTRTAFHQKRKMLRTSLKELYPIQAIEHALTLLHEPVTARPEELSTEQWITLFKSLH
ncbi:MAG: 16S rRNA (adenine(1518)-N(6)/adenine(1519)-N(6))-dimethyltransferase RsmA [Chlamydiota bacterium]